MSDKTGSGSWNKDIQKIREAIAFLRDDLGKAEPRDRLECISKIMQCIQFMKQSNVGWASLLTNPQMANELNDEALKEIFTKFRKVTLARIEHDIDSIDRYMINLIPRDMDLDPMA